MDLKQLIKDSGYTIEQVAKKLNVSRQYLSRILNTSIEDLPIDRLQAILNILGYTMNIIVAKNI